MNLRLVKDAPVCQFRREPAYDLEFSEQLVAEDPETGVSVYAVRRPGFPTYLSARHGAKVLAVWRHHDVLAAYYGCRAGADAKRDEGTER